jgi:hypothetical protein
VQWRQREFGKLLASDEEKAATDGAFRPPNTSIWLMPHWDSMRFIEGTGNPNPTLAGAAAWLAFNAGFCSR